MTDRSTAIIVTTTEEIRTIVRDELERALDSQRPLLNVKEAANYLNLSPSVVQRDWKRMGLRKASTGKRVLFHRDDLTAWIEKERHSAGEAA